MYIILIFFIKPVFSPRYINSTNGKVMQDIVSSQLYKDQFDAIQDCFRIIGFSEEVQYAEMLNNNRNNMLLGIKGLVKCTEQCLLNQL